MFEQTSIENKKIQDKISFDVNSKGLQCEWQFLSDFNYFLASLAEYNEDGQLYTSP